MKNKIETQSLNSLIFAFSGLTLSVTAFLVGNTVGMNLSLSKGIIAIIIGNIVLALYAGFIGIIGYNTRESSIMISKPVFGNYGQIITSVIVVVFLMGFVSVYSSMIGSLVHTLFPIIPAYLGNLIFIILISTTTIKGFKGISKLSKVGIPILVLFITYGLYKTNQNIGLANAFTNQPIGSLAFGLIISQVISVWTAATTFSSDMTRFAKSAKHVLITTFTAFTLTAILETVGFVLALGTGKGDLVAILQELNLVIPAFFIYLLLMWTSGQSLLYSFSLAFDNMAKMFLTSKKDITSSTWVILGGIIAFIGSAVMTAYGLTASFNKFLLTIGIAIPAIGGILIAHYHIVYRDKVNYFDNMPSFRINSFISWIIGIIIAKYINMGIPALNGLISALVFYVILESFLKNKSNLNENQSI